MAAYEKYEQQQQPPQPHLNAAYYGPPIPPQAPQPAYYAPPPQYPRRSGASCFLCSVFKIIAIIIIVLGAATLFLWLALRPSSVRAYAASATLSRFDLAAGPTGRTGELLQYNLTVDIRVRNPNRFGIRYGYAEAQASYDGERFGYGSVQPFYLYGKTDRTVTATFSGSSAVGSGVGRTYRRERGDGFYFVKARLYTDLDFKVRVFRVRGYKSKITCTLRLPVPNSNSPAVTMLGTKCAVDF